MSTPEFTTGEIIEGTFRVVATRPLSANARPSPNQRRLAARIMFWNLAAACALVFLPVLF